MESSIVTSLLYGISYLTSFSSWFVSCEVDYEVDCEVDCEVNYEVDYEVCLHIWICSIATWTKQLGKSLLSACGPPEITWLGNASWHVLFGSSFEIYIRRKIGGLTIMGRTLFVWQESLSQLVAQGQLRARYHWRRCPFRPKVARLWWSIGRRGLIQIMIHFRYQTRPDQAASPLNSLAMDHPRDSYHAIHGCVQERTFGEWP